MALLPLSFHSPAFSIFPPFTPNKAIRVLDPRVPFAIKRRLVEPLLNRNSFEKYMLIESMRT